MDDTDLSRRLDRSIGPAPDSGPPLTELLAAGRRAVRRRRITATTLIAATALVAIGGATWVGAIASERATPPVAGHGSSLGAAELDRLISYDEAGRLVVDPSVTVLSEIDDPYDLADAPGDSVALVVRGPDGIVQWAVLYRSPTASAASFAPARSVETSFQTWVDQTGPSGHSSHAGTTPLVRFADATGDRLAPLASVTISEQRSGVDLGPGFATADDDTAAATVRSSNGADYYVLARRGPGLEPWVFTASRADGGPDLDAFLDFARDRWGHAGAEGTGS